MPACRVLVVAERGLLVAGLVPALEARPDITAVRVLPDPATLPGAANDGWRVIVTGERQAGHVLRLAPAGSRVLVLVQQADVRSLARLLREGAAGACTSDDLPAEVAHAVVQVARGEMRLPGHLVVEVLVELQRLRQQAKEAEQVLAQLTQRERDVLVGLGRGLGRTELARDLGLSPHTVRTHIQHLLRKLALHSQAEAAAFAREVEVALAPAARGSEHVAVVIDLDDRKQRRGTGSRA